MGALRALIGAARVLGDLDTPSTSGPMNGELCVSREAGGSDNRAYPGSVQRTALLTDRGCTEHHGGAKNAYRAVHGRAPAAMSTRAMV